MEINKQDLYEKYNDTDTTFIWKTHENLGFYSHFHAAIEIYFVLDGSMEAEINNKKYVLNSGDMCVANPFEIHKYTQTGTSHVSVLIFTEYYLADFKALYNDKIIPNFLDDKEYNAKIFNLLKEIPYSFENSNISPLAKKAYANIILDKIISRYGVTTSTVSNNKIKEIVSYIYNNFDQKITLETLAQEFNYTKTSISRLLSKNLHTDLRCFLNHIRVEKAKSYLSDERYSHLSILQIASYCGFDSAATFYRAYKKRYNCAPRENAKQ